MDEIQHLMLIIGNLTMSLWGVGIMIFVVLIVLLFQMPSLLFRALIIFIIGFWMLSIYPFIVVG